MDPNLPPQPPSPAKAPEDAGSRGGAPRRSIPVIAVIAFGVFLISQVVAFIAESFFVCVLTVIATEGPRANQSFPTLEFLQVGLLFESIVVGAIAPAAFLLASRSFALKGEERTAKPLKIIAIALAVLLAVSLLASNLFRNNASDVEEAAELFEQYARVTASNEGEDGGMEASADFTGPRIWGALAPRAEEQANAIRRIILDQPAYRDDFSSNDEIAQYYGCPYIIEGTVTSPVDDEITFLVEDGGGVLLEDEEIRVSMSWVAARLYGMKGLQYGMDGVLIFFKEIPPEGEPLKDIVVVGNDDVPKDR